MAAAGGGGGGGGDSCRRHHGEQRSGVATVGEKSVDPVRAAAASTAPRLAALRRLVSQVLISHEPVTELGKVADSWLLSCPSSTTFGEECELVVTLLYTSLILPHPPITRLPQELVFTFLERWIVDGGRMEFVELTNLMRPEWKCGATEVLFLLCANLMPTDWGLPVLQADNISWGSEWLPGIAAPTWLVDAVGSTGDILDFITLLRVSACLLQGIPIPKVKLENSYTGTLSRFLCAASQYLQGEYSFSLETLRDIRSVMCEGRLQAWVSHLRGLGLVKIRKQHTALIKLQDAVEKSPASIPALFNIAQVFHSLDQESAELEVLELLVKSGGEMVEGPSISLHSSILSIHHTRLKDLPDRACYYLSCRCLQAKKFVKAAEHLETLLDRKTSCSEPLCSTPRSLLRPEDTLPVLPPHRVLVVLAAVAQASTACHREILRILDKFFGGGDIDVSSFYHDLPEERLKVVMAAAGLVLHAEALAGLDQVQEALRKCVRVEQAMWWVRCVNNGGDEDKDWYIIILQIKTLLYKVMSQLHESRHSLQNHHHYTRLSRQCLVALGGLQVVPTWPDMSPSNQLALDGVYKYFKNQSSDGTE